MRRVLVVEEGERIAALLRAQLGQLGWTVAAASDAVAAMGWLLTTDFDLIVIDLGLPDEGALEVVRVLHENDVLASVLVLADREDALAAFGGLDGGQPSPARERPLLEPSDPLPPSGCAWVAPGTSSTPG